MSTPKSNTNQRLVNTRSTHSARFIRRIGPHHFAYLRAVAEGLDAMDSARRYLGIQHGHEHKGAHRQLVDAVQAIARRSHERAWRLVGIAIPSNPQHLERPSLEEFVEERGLDCWSEEELVEMLEAAYPQDKRSSRRDKLRTKQMDMLRRLERSDAQHPRPTDLVSDWFDDITAKRLITAGHNTLQDLASRIAVGGQWYRSMPGIGVAKADRIASHLLTLIPAALPPEKPFFSLKSLDVEAGGSSTSSRSSSALASPALPYPAPAFVTSALPSYTSPATLTALGSAGSMLDASSDSEAVRAWIQARCSSEATVKTYTREARRLMLWLIRERSGKRFADLRIEDCLAYQAFLQNIPPAWISRNQVTPGYVGWAPFRGPLTPASQQQAITILGGLFSWLAAAKYLSGNPWLLVNRDSGQTDQVTQALDTKSFSEGVLAHIHRYLIAQPPSPSCQRMQFIVSFVEAVGLRSSELLDARLGAFSLQPEGWTMRVTGKGSKTRTVFVPRPAFEALQTYLLHRGVGSIETAPSDTALLASTYDGVTPIGYQALYLTVRRWLRKAISSSELSYRERIELDGASTHWLRHTFGTRAVAKEVPYDVIQQQLGHSSVNTTMNIYARAPLRRRAEELGKAFS